MKYMNSNSPPMQLVQHTFLLLIIGVFCPIIAQDTNETLSDVNINIPEVALIDIESQSGSKSVNLSIRGATEAGKSSVTNNTDDSLWLNYSSVVNSANPSRKITVYIASGQAPPGTYLSLKAANYTGNGHGNHGQPRDNYIILNSNANQNLITDIGSAYTGHGYGNGHKLTYLIRRQGKSADHLIRAGDYVPMTIVYTITDN